MASPCVSSFIEAGQGPVEPATLGSQIFSGGYEPSKSRRRMITCNPVNESVAGIGVDSVPTFGDTLQDNHTVTMRTEWQCGAGEKQLRRCARHTN